MRFLDWVDWDEWDGMESRCVFLGGLKCSIIERIPIDTCVALCCIGCVVYCF